VGTRVARRKGGRKGGKQGRGRGEANGGKPAVDGLSFAERGRLRHEGDATKAGIIAAEEGGLGKGKKRVRGGDDGTEGGREEEAEGGGDVLPPPLGRRLALLLGGKGI
jgi:hypothetical protein